MLIIIIVNVFKDVFSQFVQRILVLVVPLPYIRTQWNTKIMNLDLTRQDILAPGGESNECGSVRKPRVPDSARRIQSRREARECVGHASPRSLNISTGRL